MLNQKPMGFIPAESYLPLAMPTCYQQSSTQEFSTDCVENSVENQGLSAANFCSAGTFSTLHTYCSNSVYITSRNISILIGKKRDFIGFFSGSVNPRV